MAIGPVLPPFLKCRRKNRCQPGSGGVPLKEIATVKTTPKKAAKIFPVRLQGSTPAVYCLSIMIFESPKIPKRAFLPMLALGFCLAAIQAVQAAPSPKLSRILVINGPRGSHGEAVDSGEVMLKSLARAGLFQIDFITDGSQLTVPILKQYQAVLFNNTSQVGKILQESGKAAFLEWYRGGGALVAWHAAADLGGTWNWFQETIGSRFYGHSGIVGAVLKVDPEGRNHVAVRGFAPSFPFKDEWYSFRINPRGTPGTTILLTVDESTYAAPNAMGADHPMSWCRQVDGGRVFFTGLGHDKHVFSTRFFEAHLYHGVLWAAGLEATVGAAFVKPAARRAAGVYAYLGEIRVTVSGASRHRVDIYNIRGMKITSDNGAGIADYAFKGLPRGNAYWVRIENRDGPILKKVMVL